MWRGAGTAADYACEGEVPAGVGDGGRDLGAGCVGAVDSRACDPQSRTLRSRQLPERPDPGRLMCEQYRRFMPRRGAVITDMVMLGLANASAPIGAGERGCG